VQEADTGVDRPRTGRHRVPPSVPRRTALAVGAAGVLVAGVLGGLTAGAVGPTGSDRVATEGAPLPGSPRADPAEPTFRRTVDITGTPTPPEEFATRTAGTATARSTAAPAPAPAPQPDPDAHDVDIVTIGQYLRPSFRHLPVLKYYTPAEFKELKTIGLELGFKHVESGPLVRSSYHAHEQVQQATA
jgi:hypothetical protein